MRLHRVSVRLELSANFGGPWSPAPEVGHPEAEETYLVCIRENYFYRLVIDVLPDAHGAIPDLALALTIDGRKVFNGWCPSLAPHQIAQGWPEDGAFSAASLFAPPASLSRAFRFGECLKEAETGLEANLVTQDHPLLDHFGRIEVELYDLIEVEEPTVEYFEPACGGGAPEGDAPEDVVAKAKVALKAGVGSKPPPPAQKKEGSKNAKPQAYTATHSTEFIAGAHFRTLDRAAFRIACEEAEVDVPPETLPALGGGGGGGAGGGAGKKSAGGGGGGSSSSSSSSGGGGAVGKRAAPDVIDLTGDSDGVEEGGGKASLSKRKR